MHTPAFADLRIIIVPDLRKRIQLHQCRLSGRGLIDRDGFVDYAAMLTDFDDKAVHINNGIQRIQLLVLSLRDLLFYGVGHLRYQRG